MRIILLVCMIWCLSFCFYSLKGLKVGALSTKGCMNIRPVFNNLLIVSGKRLSLGEFVLTFDDGPNEITTPQLLDTLKKYNVTAMFFWTTVNMQNPELLHRAKSEGHILGAHTYAHSFMNSVNDSVHNTEIFKQEESFYNVFHAIPWAFRAPGGELPLKVQKKLAYRGYIAFGWDIDVRDYLMKTADQVIRALKPKLQRDKKGIILLHEHKWTTNAMDAMLSSAKTRNVVFKHPLSLLDENNHWKMNGACL